jgi:glutamate N-acetyltransferase/amino-acid N-acetyltransferase
VESTTGDDRGVTAAVGFRSSGAAIGIKTSGAPDVALLAADRAVPAVAVFTSSQTAAPPVELGRARLGSGSLRAVIVNSGIANAGPGTRGMAAAIEVGAAVAEALGCDEDDVLVCSTGVIGPRIPVERIVASVSTLVESLGSGAAHDEQAARGIMTTDSVPKRATAVGDGWVIGGMAKGAGMLRPDMATMLAYLTTDALVDVDVMRPMLGRTVATTFNCLNVDGCQSTNDTVVLMASGDSGVRPDLELFEAALEAVCGDLAWQMASDAEGATKVVTIELSGAVDDASARKLGMQIADSSLVRSAFHGADPNWGRVLGALGAAGVAIDQQTVEISFAGVPVCSGGVAVGADEDAVHQLMAGDFEVVVSVGDGPGRTTVVTTDLTPDYVRFNADRS